MGKPARKRVLELDCLKWFAILCVVVGHFANFYTSDSQNYKAVFIFIYAFHMPLFIFVSGLFNRERKAFPVDTVVFYVVLALLIRVWIAVCQLISGVTPAFGLLGDSGASWFMFALAGFMCLCYLLQRAKPIAVISVSLLVACMVGYDSDLGDQFALMRIVVFFPFYYLGFLLKPEDVLEKLRSVPYLVIGIAVIAFFAVLCFVYTDAVYSLRLLFTGRNPYSVVPIDGCGFQHRLLCYLISGLLCASFLAVFSHIKLKLMANLGQNTLAVYFWHVGFMFFPMYAGVYAQCKTLPFGDVWWLALAAVLTLVLSHDVFRKPLDWLQQALRQKGRGQST